MPKQHWKQSIPGQIPGHVQPRIDRLGWMARTPNDKILLEEVCKSRTGYEALKQCHPGRLIEQLTAVHQTTDNEALKLRLGWAFNRAYKRFLAAHAVNDAMAA